MKLERQRKATWSRDKQGNQYFTLPGKEPSSHRCFICGNPCMIIFYRTPARVSVSAICHEAKCNDEMLIKFSTSQITK